MPSIRYGFTYGYCPITDSGFPHSEISGSTLTYSSPKHIGVCPVLHRLLVPRHPPCALSNLTKHTLRCLALSFSSKREPFVAFLTACYLVFKEQSAKITRDIPSKLNEAKKRCYYVMSSYEPRTVLRFSLCLAPAPSPSSRFDPAVAATASSQALQRLSGLNSRLRFSLCLATN